MNCSPLRRTSKYGPQQSDGMSLGREEPFDGRWFARLEDVVQSVHKGETKTGNETGDMIECREKNAKARSNPRRDIDASPGKVQNECVDVGGIVVHHGYPE